MALKPTNKPTAPASPDPNEDGDTFSTKAAATVAYIPSAVDFVSDAADYVESVIGGEGLDANAFTDDEKAKLETVETNARAQDPQHRPGLHPDIYRDNSTGATGAAPGTTVTTAVGAVRRLTGVGTLGMAQPVWVDDDGRYTVVFAARRSTDPSDPSGDAVRFGIQWIDKDGAALSVLSDADLTKTLTVSDGRWRVELLLGGDSTAEILDHVWPSGTAGFIPYVQTFGSDGITDVEELGWRYAPSPAVFDATLLVTKKTERTLFVSPGGASGNNGETLGQAVPTIEAARDIIAASSDPISVLVYPGEYETSGHIDVPDNCTGIVAATNARSTKIKPSSGNESQNVFRLGDGGYLEGFSFEGWQVDDLDDPTEGFAVSFRPDAVIRRAVFAFNITVYRPAPPTLMPPPLDRANGNPLVGHGPGVALADALVASPYSPFPQIMLWGATPVSPNGIGYCAKNGAFLNGINAVALWMHKHYLALSGGEIILTNCASQFGDYSLWAEGSCPEVVPATTSTAMIVDATAANAIKANASTIIDTMWTAMVAEGYGAISETATRNDAALLLLALEYDLRTGQQESAKRFAKGLFNSVGAWVAPSVPKAAFQFAFENIRDQTYGLSGVTTPAMVVIAALINDVVVATMNNPTTRTKPSKITSVGHQWNGTMSGVNGRALDRPSLEVPASIVQRSLGRVTYSGIDDQGKQYFSGGAIVNPVTGRLEGPPIPATINPRARRAALIAGGQR